MACRIVLAWNRRNAGMYSVDLGAASFADSLGEEVAYYSTYPESSVTAGDPRFRIRDITALGRDCRDSDRLIYWGDFTTSPRYGLVNHANTFAKSVRGRALFFLPDRLRSGIAFRMWRRYFSEIAVRRKFSLCQNFQTLAADAAGRSWPGGFKVADHLLAFERICARDSVSCEAVRDATGGRARVSFGMDAAFLPELPRRAAGPCRGSQPRVGLLLFRSNLRHAERLHAMLDDRHADWEDMAADWLGLEARGVERSFADLIARLVRCDLVISDTYHFIINAVRSHVPVIGLGGVSHFQDRPAADFKKEILFRDLGIPEHYVISAARDCDGPLLSRIGELMERIGTDQDERFHAAVDARVAGFRDELRELVA
jgi:hypothetical protein